MPVTTGIYGLRDIFKQNFDYRLYEGKKVLIESFNQVSSSYIAGLKTLLSEIFNPNIPFTKVLDKKKCEFCDYKMICHR